MYFCADNLSEPVKGKCPECGMIHMRERFCAALEPRLRDFVRKFLDRSNWAKGVA